MGIKDKQTYGEYYWAMQVEAQKFFNEGIENDLAPYFRGLLSDIVAAEDLPAGIKNFFMSFIEPKSQTTGAVGMRFASEIADSIAGAALEPYTAIARRHLHKLTQGTILTAQQASLLYRRKKIPDSLLKPYMQYMGYNDVQAGFINQTWEPYPTIPELILYSRYHGDPENIHDELIKHYEIEPLDYKLWEWLGLQRITLLQAQSLLKRGLYTEGDFYSEIARMGWHSVDQDAIKDLSYILPNPMLLVQGGLMQDIGDDTILTNISMGDIHPDYAQTYLDAVLTKPASQDIVAYELRKDPSLTNLPERLRKIGIHPDYNPLYKELAYQIPPVADIITMAVREAFTPEIARKFGQYEDYPPDLETWAMKKGLSKEWSQRYWAAHWNLPSPLQGFEMLHRGVINESELNMLLRALDVMPFWRGKLTQIAYRRLTRVDIRRMYKTGVITRAEVYESYIEHGYNPKNAERMTAFTVAWAMPKHASITRSDILSAYKNRMIPRTEAAGLLVDMGETYFHLDFMLKAVDYKKDLELTENKIKGIRNLYKRRVYNVNKTTDELLKLDLPAEEVDDLLTQWYYEIKAEVPRRWTTSQVLSFIKAGLITLDRGRVELGLIGYDNEHINVYLESI